MRNAVVAQACSEKPVQVVGDGAHRGGDDGLVERGQEHAHHQSDEDRQDLPVGHAASHGLRRAGGAVGGRLC